MQREMYGTIFPLERGVSREEERRLVNELLDFIILSELYRGRMHGYALMKNIKRKFGYNPGTSRVYPTLWQLERKGYITSERIEANGRLRRVYELTKRGRLIFSFISRELESMLRKMKSISPAEKWYRRLLLDTSNFSLKG
ncbi:MAG: hypothetical protein DRP00_03160 [Candidatus Aenigmatarchaeota archaeon]|nr:MAG: hypothetical protein DRP00_03160 [Candidatus Aenigmarchaeota archaeon]